MFWPHFYQTRSAWSMDQWSTKKRSAVHNFVPTVTKFCVMWEGLSLPHDSKCGNCRGETVGRRVIFIWSLIHGSSWSGLIKVGPAHVISIVNNLCWLVAVWTTNMANPDANKPCCVQLLPSISSISFNARGIVDYELILLIQVLILYRGGSTWVFYRGWWQGNCSLAIGRKRLMKFW